MYLRQLLLSFKRWLISDDPWYDWADQYLDGLTDLPYEDWLARRFGA